MSLTFPQWLKLLAAVPEIVAEVRAALPVIMPLVKRITKLVEELELDKPAAGQPITPKELVTRPHALNVDEQRQFDRIGHE